MTSTAMVGGALVAVPAHPLNPITGVTAAQTTPAEAEAYAFAEQLNLSAPGVRELLSTDDDRGVDAILQLLEAEQAWDEASDNNQDPDLSDIDVELLGLLDIEIGGVTLPLIGEGGLLQGEFGALRAYANTPAADEARAATGLITDTGALDLSGTGTGGNASLDLTSVLGLNEALAPLLDEASLNLGTLSSAAWNENGTPGSNYQIADAELVIDSPLVGDAVDTVQEAVNGLDGTLNGLLNEEGVVNSILGLVSGLGEIIGTGISLSAEIPLADINNALLAEPLEDESGLVSIDLTTGQISVDLEQLHTDGLNSLPADTSLLSDAQLSRITDTVTSLLTAGAVENPNGLNARLQNVLTGDGERSGLYGTEVQVQLTLLGGLAGVDLRTTLGGLLNDDVARTRDEAVYNADTYNNYLLENRGLANLLTPLTALLQPIVGAVGTVVEGLLFGDETEQGLLSGLIGDVQEDAISPLLTSLNPLLEGVLTPIADIIVNRQEDDGELFKVSALEVNLLGGALSLPIATSAVYALSQADAVTVTGTAGTVDPTDTAQETGLTVSNRNEDTTEFTAVDEDDTELPVTFGTPDADGNETILITPGENVDGPITLTVTDPTLAGSPQEYTVTVAGHTAGEDDNDSEYTGPIVDDSNVTPVDPTEDPQDTGVDVTDTSDDTTITAEDDNGTEVPVEIDEDGNVIVTPGENVEGPITVVIDDPALEDPIEVEVPVNPEGGEEPGDTAPSFGGEANPVDPTDEEQDTGLNLENGTDDTDVTARDEDGQNIPVNVDEDGNIHVTPGENVDGPITVVIDDPALTDPIESDVPITGHTAGEDDNDSEATTADQVTPTYDEVSAPQDEETTVPAPIFTDADSASITLDEDPVFSNGEGVPSWATVNEDGSIILTPSSDENSANFVGSGDQTVPVQITYADTSTDTIDVPVTITDALSDGVIPAIDGTPVEVPRSGEAEDTEVNVTGLTEESVITAEDNLGNEVTVTVDETGNILVTPTEDTGDQITVTITDPDLAEDITFDVPVVDPDTGENPAEDTPSFGGTPNPVDPTDEEQDTGLNLENGTDDTNVTARDEDNQEIPVEVDEDGNISVTPGTDVTGPITITVTDPALDAPIEAEVPVNEDGQTDPGEDVPAIAGISDQIATVGEKFGPLGIVVSDPAATVTVSGLPAGLIYDAAAGTIAGIPAEDSENAYEVTVSASNAAGADTETFSLTVNPADAQDTPSFGGTPNPVDPTDEEQDTGLNLENQGPETNVEARDEDNQDIPVNVDENGNISVTPGEDVDGPITITVTDPALDASIEAEVPVTGHTPGEDDNGSDQDPTEDTPSIGGIPTPVFPEDREQDTGLDLENQGPETDVEARDEDNEDIPVDIDEDGNISVTPGEDVDGPITIIVTDPELDTPITEEVPVVGHTPGIDDNNSGDVSTGVAVGSSDSWITNIFGGLLALLGLGGIFASVMEFMHQNSLLGQAEDQWWMNLTNRR
ncbi:choice-of-anchor G family protein [Corynebacterium halotolerans]|uniref:choice-of-anchor G family protein n=1 Tax=Corynebacterium halotolerans TaxID=225326 RepID=UPI003CF37196